MFAMSILLERLDFCGIMILFFNYSGTILESLVQDIILLVLTILDTASILVFKAGI